jgi:hypothetical protein
MKSKIWIFSLEPIETRYTGQWQEHLPKLFKNKLGNDFDVVQIDGVQKNSHPTPGAFLNFSDTNYWKSSQLCKFLEHHNNGETTKHDHFVFTDAWNPTILQIKYMSDLLGFRWTLHGLWHAGSYDPADFLGRLIGNTPWVRDAERSFFGALDYNYFASQFHIDLFSNTFLDHWARESCVKSGKIVRTGWPMEYLEDTLTVYQNIPKRDLILFPHRIAPEKQVDIFRDLKEHLPQYEFVICQEQELTKNEYHNLLGEAKLIFSANLQETLGISWYEGASVGALPLVPDRLSYTEMALDTFKYPSEWTESYTMYERYRPYLAKKIMELMSNYEKFIPRLNKQVEYLKENYFTCENLLKNIK